MANPISFQRFRQMISMKQNLFGYEDRWLYTLFNLDLSKIYVQKDVVSSITHTLLLPTYQQRICWFDSLSSTYISSTGFVVLY